MTLPDWDREAVEDRREPETEEYYEKQGRFGEDLRPRTQDGGLLVQSQAQPTPGPWEARDQSVTGPRGVSIAYCGQSMVAGLDGSYCIDLEESRLNAKLVAAAPDMLAALVAIRAAFRAGNGMFVAQVMAGAAIKKAVGR